MTYKFEAKCRRIIDDGQLPSSWSRCQGGAGSGRIISSSFLNDANVLTVRKMLQHQQQMQQHELHHQGIKAARAAGAAWGSRAAAGAWRAAGAAAGAAIWKAAATASTGAEVAPTSNTAVDLNGPRIWRTYSENWTSKQTGQYHLPKIIILLRNIFLYLIFLSRPFQVVVLTPTVTRTMIKTKYFQTVRQVNILFWQWRTHGSVDRIQ